MGLLCICLSLLCLLHVTCQSPVYPFPESRTPTNFSQINGLWNIKATAAFTYQPEWDTITYVYQKISLSENEANVSTFHWLVFGTGAKPIVLQRVYDEKETLTYKLSIEALGVLQFFQPYPDSLFIQRKQNGEVKTAALYIRLTSIPESELNHFKQWTESHNLTHYKEYPVTHNYAQTCHGVFKEENRKIQENVTSWHLVAKSTNTVDRRYDLRILYKAKLETSKKNREYTIREIITLSTDKILFESEYKANQDHRRILHFMTDEDLLLLGVQNDTKRTLYLASTTPTVKQSVIEKFKKQALCYETTYNYFIPGSIEKDASEACIDELELPEPINFQEIAGPWKLNAYASNGPLSHVLFPSDIQFIVSNEEVTISYGSWKSEVGKIGDRRLHFSKVGESVMEMRFHKPLGDSLLTWVGNTAENKNFLLLFSKYGKTTSDDDIKLKHFASCLSLRLITQSR